MALAFRTTTVPRSLTSGGLGRGSRHLAAWGRSLRGPWIGGHVSKVPQPDSSARQVRTFRDLFLITEVLDSPRPRATMSALKRSWARMSCQIERAFWLFEVLKKAAADPSNRSSID